MRVVRATSPRAPLCVRLICCIHSSCIAFQQRRGSIIAVSHVLPFLPVFQVEPSQQVVDLGGLQHKGHQDHAGRQLRSEMRGRERLV